MQKKYLNYLKEKAFMKAAGNRTVGVTRSANYTAVDDLRNTGHVSVINPINLDYCGKEQCSPGYQFGPYVRTCFVVHFVLSGKGVLEKNGVKHSIREGQTFLIYPNEECVYRADEKDPWKYMWVGFHGYLAEEFMLNAGFTKELPVQTLQNIGVVERIMNFMLEQVELTHVNELQRMSALYAILAELSKGKEEVKTHGSEQEYDYVRMAIDIMTSSYNKNIKVSDLADMIGLNRSYLTTLFKKEMKMSPQEFLIQFRMEKACSLLRTTKSPITSIAESIGYRDGLTFSKAFKREYGVSPAEFREQKTVSIVKKAKGDYEGMWPL